MYAVLVYSVRQLMRTSLSVSHCLNATLFDQNADWSVLIRSPSDSFRQANLSVRCFLRGDSTVVTLRFKESLTILTSRNTLIFTMQRW
jgi:hypothetical protein